MNKSAHTVTEFRKYNFFNMKNTQNQLIHTPPPKRTGGMDSVPLTSDTSLPIFSWSKISIFQKIWKLKKS